MNDRFRFRAWVVGHYFSENDEEKEILVKINDVTVYNDGTIGIDYHSLLESVCNLLTNENERESLLEYFEDKNCTTGDDWYYLEAKFIEQCTGLKDKNGRLIYEGDILKGANGSVNGSLCEFTGVVKWLKQKARFDLPVWAYDKDGNYSDDWSHWFEVVGNIHDNAGLLEAENGK